ncbi:BolA protein [Dillenia turbinata]|uniref:BolA protein n=1 Tax=Dillenia turbinata TaxID=194707 RepID=A0AAN8VY92_9MAGN
MARNLVLIRPHVFFAAGPALPRQPPISFFPRCLSTCTLKLTSASGSSFHGAKIQLHRGLSSSSALNFKVSRKRNLCMGATHVNEPGSIDSSLMQSMETKIKEQLNAESVTVKDAYGDGRHVSIDVVSSAFEGQSAVNRQRMVYKAIWEELQSTVHAVDQMTTRTPTEAAAQK